MKEYRIYRNIRKRALIFGLPVSFFALQMSAVILGLLIIIFSFGPMAILVVFLGNIGLYLGLLKVSQNPWLSQLVQNYPSAIRNNKSTNLFYERH